MQAGPVIQVELYISLGAIHAARRAQCGKARERIDMLSFLKEVFAIDAVNAMCIHTLYICIHL